MCVTVSSWPDSQWRLLSTMNLFLNQLQQKLYIVQIRDFTKSTARYGHKEDFQWIIISLTIQLPLSRRVGLYRFTGVFVTFLPLLWFDHLWNMILKSFNCHLFICFKLIKKFTFLKFFPKENPNHFFFFFFV